MIKHTRSQFALHVSVTRTKACISCYFLLLITKSSLQSKQVFKTLKEPCRVAAQPPESPTLTSKMKWRLCVPSPGAFCARGHQGGEVPGDSAGRTVSLAVTLQCKADGFLYLMVNSFGYMEGFPLQNKLYFYLPILISFQPWLFLIKDIKYLLKLYITRNYEWLTTAITHKIFIIYL